MRLLFYMGGYCLGGVETVHRNLFSALPRSEFQVVTACRPGRVSKFLLPYVDEMIDYDPDTNEAFPLLEKVKPTLVMATNSYILEVGIAARQLKIPLLWYCAGIGSLIPMVDRAIQLAACLADQIVTPSQFIRRDIGKNSENAIKVIPNGIDTDHFFPSTPSERNSLRNQLGLPKGAFVFGHVSRLDPQKRQIDLIRILARVRRTGGNFHALLVMSGADDRAEAVWEKLIGEAKKLGVRDALHMVGSSHANVRDFLGVMDAFVFPGEKEGLGCALLEAMAMQLPVLVAKSGGQVEPLSYGDCGFVVSPEDIAAYSRHLTQLSKKKALARQLGKKGRGIVQEHYSLQAMAKGYANLFHRFGLKA